MKILSGDKIGGFKLDYTTGGENNGSTGELFPELIGDGSTWETYTFTISIPLGVDGFKVVPLWGKDSASGSEVGFDNIGFDPTPAGGINPVVPNGFFEEGSTSWFEEGGASFSYPASGGNPDGHGRIGSADTAGTWTAAGGAPITLSSLGITPGETVTFKQDMKIFDGSSIGGVRLEFFSGDAIVLNTDNVFPSLIGDGSTWETYELEVAVPSNAEAVKILILGAANSTVDFDNVTVGDAEIPPPAPVDGSSGGELVFGTLFSWTNGSDPDNFYQPQTSDDAVTWTNLGPAFTGSTDGQGFDPSNADFTRVLEFGLISGDAIQNGDFEGGSSGTPPCPDSWTCLSPSGQAPSLLTTDAFEGTNSLRIAVQNDTSGTPNQSEIQQNIVNAGGSITPGNTYDFSFYAKQISFGVSYVQNYRLSWLNADGGVISEAFGFTPFTGGTNSWVEFSRTGLIAPAGADSGLIQIFGATGAVAGADARGEVLIDNISLDGPPSPGNSTVIPTSDFLSGVGIQFPTVDGLTYQAQSSFDLDTFNDIGASFEGNGEPAAVGIQFDENFGFFRCIESQ